MRTKRTSLVIGLLVILSLVLAACPAPAPVPAGEAAEAPAEAAAPSAEEPIEIEYWQYNFGARVDAMNQLIEQFEAENPGITVVHNSDIPYDDFRNKIAASVPAGVGPDVATLFYGWQPAWIDAGYLVPLPDDVFPPAMIAEEFSPLAQARLSGRPTLFAAHSRPHPGAVLQQGSDGSRRPGPGKPAHHAGRACRKWPLPVRSRTMTAPMRSWVSQSRQADKVTTGSARCSYASSASSPTVTMAPRYSGMPATAATRHGTSS